MGDMGHSNANEPAVFDRAEDRRLGTRLLHSRNVLVRFSTALGLGLAAMFLAWAAACLFLRKDSGGRGVIARAARTILATAWIEQRCVEDYSNSFLGSATQNDGIAKKY